MAQFVPRPEPVTATDVVENLGAEMAARYAEAEERMIERVARLAAAGIDADEFPDVTDRLRILRELRAEGARIAEQLADPAEVRRIMAIAEAEGRQAALEQLAIGRQRPNLSGITGTTDRAVGALTLDLASGLENMSARITRWMPDAYQQVVSLVAPQVLAGVVTITQAQRQAAQRFLARGVTGFTDRAGRNWRIGTYAEMATRTAVHRAWTDANVGAMRDQAGIALVQIVIGLDACSVCAAHAGRVWSTDGTPAGTYTRPHAATGEPVTVTVAGTLDQARASGWDHPNCRCTVVGYFPGLTVPSASTHDPQAEADRDRLRELERRVRDLKRREAAAFDDITRQQLRRRIRGAQANIREHVATTGQVRKPYREQLGFSDGATGTPRTPTGTRPPTPSPSTPPADMAPELPALPVADDTPEWIRQHRAAAERLPADRRNIGRLNGRILDEAEARRLALEPLDSQRRVELDYQRKLRERRDLVDQVVERFRTDPDFITRPDWGDLTDTAQKLGIRTAPQRYAKDFTSGAARARIDKALAESEATASRLSARIDRVAAQNFRARVIDGRPDVTALGELGDATRDALDATLEAGRIVDDEIARRLARVPGRPTIPDPADIEQARARWNAAEAEWARAIREQADPADIGRLARIVDDSRNEWRELNIATARAREWDAVNRSRITREVLGELRDYGGGSRSTYVTESGRAASATLRDAMEDAAQKYPTAWNDEVADAFADVVLKPVKRGYNARGFEIGLSGTREGGANLARVAVHELGHSMERAVPGLSNLEWAFHYRRSAKVVDPSTGAASLARPVHLGRGFGKEERFVPDEWADNYTGKVYPRATNPVDDSWEVFTTGVESVFDGSPYFRRTGRITEPDDEFRQFILGVLSAL